MAGESEPSGRARSRSERSCPKEVLDHQRPDQAEQRRPREGSAPDPRLPGAGSGHRPVEAWVPAAGRVTGMLPEPPEPAPAGAEARGRAVCSTVLAASRGQMV